MVKPYLIQQYTGCVKPRKRETGVATPAGLRYQSSMAHILNIVTRKDEFMEEVLRAEKEIPGHEIETFDLTASQPDYAKLLERIFAAEKVHVW